MSFHNTNPRQDHWQAYYQAFPYFSSDKIRPYCHPRMMEHDEPAEKAVVLVHGLTDSPYFMSAIANHFYDKLGYNVYLPLLHCHGLLEPDGMEGVDYNQWIANVEFAVETAAAKSKYVSVGGLSTGGALSLYEAYHNPKVNGDVFLFSACFDVAGGLKGEIQEWLLRTGLVDRFDKKDHLVKGNENPYRYGNFDFDGARELTQLLKKTDKIFKALKKSPFDKRVFAAHSESDISANIKSIEDLEERTSPGNFKFFRIAKSEKVPHACVVLKDPVYGINAVQGDKPLEAKNPLFDEMIEELTAFEKTR